MLTPGSRVGPYEIIAPLGAGGMGEVYRARDSRLGRDIAIKVLPPSLARDPERLARFEREAKAIASLQHPHICTLHDVGHYDGTDYLVMEHLEGETLANRIERAPLPLDAALEYAIQIAAALDAAHRAGVIHRDLKPSNIMLTQAGAKLLDFGLAKLRPVQGVVNGGPAAPTLTAPLTREGILLGTLQYMAPEQLHGKEADARSDLFAFGAILYEITARRKAFIAQTNASLIGAILRDEPPPISSVQPLASRTLNRLVRACLSKEPLERWQSAGDMARELGWILEDYRAGRSDGDIPPIHGLASRRVVAVGTALALIAVVAAILINSLRNKADEVPPAGRFTIQLPDSTLATASVPVAQISPDGRRVAFIVATAETRLPRISLRAMDGQHAESVPATEGAVALFWSPDSRQLAFTTISAALKKLTISDLTVQTLCDGCRSGRGGTWSRSGLIVFPSQDGRLMGISAAGGEPQTLTTPNASVGDMVHVAPHFLPDGRRFLYVSRNADSRRGGLYVRQVGSGEPRLLLQGDHPAIYASPGYLLFNRAGNIMAQAFDVSRLEFTGDAILLVASSEYWPTPVHSPDVIFLTWFGSWPSFSTSDTGVLTYAIAEQPQSRFQWIGSSGEPQLVGEPGSYMTFDLAPDDRRLVFSRGDAVQASLWILDLARGVTSRLTFGASSSYYDPRWGPRGQWIAANRPVPPPADIVKVFPDGSESIVSTQGELCVLDDVSKDGQSLLCRRDGGRELVAKPLVSGQPAIVRKSPAGGIDQSRFSPDGRWIAYNADESGRYEVYLTAFPSTGERWQISHEGGVQPVWRADGRGLYYLGLDGVLNAVTMRTGNHPQFSHPDRLFQTGLATPSPWIEQYAVSADGRRILMLKPVDTKVRNSMGVIVNWPTLLNAGRIER